MATDGEGCGWLYALYVATRSGDVEGMRDAFAELKFNDDMIEEATLAPLKTAVDAGDTATAGRRASEMLFGGAEEPLLDGPAARLVGSLLYTFGYTASFILFFRADSREAVVDRLRWAYRRVGVKIQDTETVDGTERTTFRCPYRNLGADRWGRRHVCHDVLDLVDDGYVDWLARHRDIDYQRPRACASSACCYSEVTEL